MQDLPHHYHANAVAQAEGNVVIDSPQLVAVQTAAPAEFGGPGDLWSPETLLVASVANCFILTFRAVARASKLEWTDVSCDVEGVLDRVERAMQFTSFTLRVKLKLAAGADAGKAQKMLEKAEHGCLITNSLKAESHLQAEVIAA